MKAMILAAGLGERMLPLTNAVPKPLLPIVNIPIIRYNLEFLRHYGFTEIIINLFHLSKQIEQELGDGSALGVKLAYSHEAELWGTGGGLKLVEDYFKDEEYFVLMNADILVDCDLNDAIHFHQRHDATATMILTQDAPVKYYGAVEIDEKFNVRNIAGKLDDVRESERIAGVFTGIHVLSPRVFEYIPPNINSCIANYGYPKMIRNSETVIGYVMQGFWSDVGRPETFYSTNMAYLERRIQVKHLDPLAGYTLKPAKDKTDLSCLGENVELGAEISFQPPFVVGHNVRIGDKAKIGPHAVIGDGCQVGKLAQISESVVLPGVKVGNRQKVVGLIMGKKEKLRVPSSAGITQIIPSFSPPEDEEN